jgi:hypothetical protein
MRSCCQTIWIETKIHVQTTLKNWIMRKTILFFIFRNEKSDFWIGRTYSNTNASNLIAGRSIEKIKWRYWWSADSIRINHSKTTVNRLIAHKRTSRNEIFHIYKIMNLFEESNLLQTWKKIEFIQIHVSFSSNFESHVKHNDQNVEANPSSLRNCFTMFDSYRSVKLSREVLNISEMMNLIRNDQPKLSEMNLAKWILMFPSMQLESNCIDNGLLRRCSLWPKMTSLAIISSSAMRSRFMTFLKYRVSDWQIIE